MVEEVRGPLGAVVSRGTEAPGVVDWSSRGQLAKLLTGLEAGKLTVEEVLEQGLSQADDAAVAAFRGRMLRQLEGRLPGMLTLLETELIPPVRRLELYLEMVRTALRLKLTSAGQVVEEDKGPGSPKGTRKAKMTFSVAKRPE